MHKTKAFKLIKQFSPDEIERLVPFIQASSFVSMRSQVVALATVIQEHAPDFEGEWLKKENLYRKAFPDDEYNYGYIAKVMSYLYDMTLKFLGFIEAEREEAAQFALAGFQLQARGLDEFAEDALKKAARTAEESPYRDGEYYRVQYLSATLSGILEQGDLHNVKSDYASQVTLDVYYLRDKLHLSSLMQEQAILVGGLPTSPLLDWLLPALKGHPYLGVPIVGVYYRALMMNIDAKNSDSHYYEFSCLLAFCASQLPKEYRISLHSKAMNFCLRKYISGRQGYAAEAFALDKKANDDGFLIRAGILPDRKFKGIVALALEVNETKWAKEFIEKYAPRLSEDTRKITVDFVCAELEVVCGNYAAARKLLRSFKRLDDFDFVKLYVLETRINVETRDWEGVWNSYEKARKFFQRNQSFAENYRERARPLFLFTSRLARLFISASPNKMEAFEKMKQEANEKFFNGQAWFLEQLEKLEAEFSEVSLPKFSLSAPTAASAKQASAKI